MLLYIALFGCIQISPDEHTKLIEELEEESNSTSTNTSSQNDSHATDSTTETNTDTATNTETTTDTETSTDTGTEPNTETETDSDNDGLTDEEEAILGTDPYHDDSDGDGLSDGDEVNVFGTDPLHHDSDGDRLSDHEEIEEYGTDPLSADTDGGGVPDGVEVWLDETDPVDHEDDEIDLYDDNGLKGGELDIDTSNEISSVDDGSRDAHSSAYDDDYDTTQINTFNFYQANLQELSDEIGNNTRKFKLLVSNPSLSPGARLVFNQSYDAGTPSTWTEVGEYADTPLSLLPIYSLDGGNGSEQLASFSVAFDTYAIPFNEVHGTRPNCVKNNELGPNEEWRNGALTVQAVMINDDGSDAFTSDVDMTAGGLHGPATTGLLWEMVIFWHWDGDCYE